MKTGSQEALSWCEDVKNVPEHASTTMNLAPRVGGIPGHDGNSYEAVPTEFKERIAGVTIRFEDRPSKAMIALGGDPDVLSLTERNAKQVVVFLMFLQDRFGKYPEKVRQELRRATLRDLADMAGMEWMGED